MDKLTDRARELLKKSEAVFKTDMVYLAKGGLWLGLGQVIASLSSFFLAIAFANLLPKETYGTYKYILAMAGTLTVFTLTGMGTAVTQAVARGSIGTLLSAMREKIRFGAVGSIVSFIAAAYYYTNGNMTLCISFVLIGIFMPFMESFGLYDSVLQGKKLFDVSIKYFVIGQITSVALLILSIFITKNVLVLVFVYFASWTIFRLIVVKKILEGIPAEQSSASLVLSYGKHLSFMGVIGVLTNYADSLLIFHFLGAIPVAIYSIATAPIGQVRGLFKNINTLALPKLSERSHRDISSMIYKRLWQISLLGALISIAYIMAAPFVFKIFFPKYLGSVLLSQVYSLTLIFAAPMNIFSAAFQSKPVLVKEMYLINIVSGIILVSLLLAFGFFWGIMGIVVARITHYFCLLVLNILFWKSGQRQTS